MQFCENYEFISSSLCLEVSIIKFDAYFADFLNGLTLFFKVFISEPII
jgi:hypothetical protein